MRFVSKPSFLNKVSVHFYSLASTRNKCVYALSVTIPCPAPSCLRFKMMDPGFICCNNPG
jgi:hypothetical protein